MDNVYNKLIPKKSISYNELKNWYVNRVNEITDYKDLTNSQLKDFWITVQALYLLIKKNDSDNLYDFLKLISLTTENLIIQLSIRVNAFIPDFEYINEGDVKTLEERFNAIIESARAKSIKRKHFRSNNNIQFISKIYNSIISLIGLPYKYSNNEIDEILNKIKSVSIRGDMPFVLLNRSEKECFSIYLKNTIGVKNSNDFFRSDKTKDSDYVGEEEIWKLRIIKLFDYVDKDNLDNNQSKTEKYFEKALEKQIETRKLSESILVEEY